MRVNHLKDLLDRPPMAVGSLQIDARGLCATTGDANVLLEPKVMALLVLLAEQPGETRSREDLIDLIWTERAASDESLTRLAYQLRKGLSALGEATPRVKTISRLGYALQVGSDTAERATFPDDTKLPLIAVFPAENLSPEPDSSHLAYGMTRDITNMMSRNTRLKVIANSSVEHHLVSSGSVAAAAERLRAHYILTLSLDTRGTDLRMRAELANNRDGSLAWSGRFDAPLAEFFDVQDRMVRQVCAAVSATVGQPLQNVITSQFDEAIYARIQAAEALRVNYSRENAEAIVSILQDARELDPEHPEVMAALAMQLSQNLVSQWASDPAATRELSLDLIERALSNSPENAQVRSAAGVVYTMLHDPLKAIGHLEFAVRNNPADTHALAVLGWCRALALADPEGVAMIERAERFAPHHPRFGLWATYRGTAQIFLLDYDSAVPACQEARARTPNYYQPWLTLAWALAGSGADVEAARSIAEASAMEGPAICADFVAEMHDWIAPSPNREACALPLDRLLKFG